MRPRFSSLATLGQDFQHSVILAEGQMNAPLPVNHSNATEECTAFISALLQMGGGEKNSNGSLVIIEHVRNPLCTNFSFPQALGEDMVNTCWRDSNFCSNCSA